MSKLSKRNICKVQCKGKENIINEIIENNSDQEYPFRVIDVQIHIQKVFWVIWSYQKLRIKWKLI